MKPTKRTVLWIVPILIIGVFYYFYGPKDDITENEHIDYIKAQALVENSNLPVGEAFERYCSKSEWVYFETQKRQKVVEFKGECPHGKAAQPVNLQFLVDEEGDDFVVGVLLVDHVQQTEEERTSYIHTVYAQ
ncbi:MAG: glucosamine 6-phosphate synthetase [Lysinibacillus sp.]